MTRHPFNPGELGGDDPTLVGLADELERSATTSAQPSTGFASRVLAAIDEEPTPRRPWYAIFGGAASAPLFRGLSLAAVAVAAVAIAVVVGGLIGPVRPGPGANGSATPTASPSPPSTPPSSTPSPSPSPSASPSPTPTFEPRTVQPSESAGQSETSGSSTSASPSDDHGGGSGGGSGSASPSDSGHGGGDGSSS